MSWMVKNYIGGSTDSEHWSTLWRVCSGGEDKGTV